MIFKKIQSTEIIQDISPDCNKKVFGPLLQALINASSKNLGKHEFGWRYEDPLKLLAAIVYLLSGKMAYEIIQANLKSSFPSINAVRNLIDARTRNFEMGRIASRILLECFSY